MCPFGLPQASWHMSLVCHMACINLSQGLGAVHKPDICQWQYFVSVWTPKSDLARHCSLAEVWVSLHELLCSQPRWRHWYTFYTEIQKGPTHTLASGCGGEQEALVMKISQNVFLMPTDMGTLFQVPKWICHKISLTLINLHQCSVMWFGVLLFPKNKRKVW